MNTRLWVQWALATVALVVLGMGVSSCQGISVKAPKATMDLPTPVAGNLAPFTVAKCDEMLKQAVLDRWASQYINNAGIAAIACYQSLSSNLPRPIGFGGKTPAQPDSETPCPGGCHQPPAKDAPSHRTTLETMAKLADLKLETLVKLNLGRYADICSDPLGCLIDCVGGVPCALRKIEALDALPSPDAEVE